MFLGSHWPQRPRLTWPRTSSPPWNFVRASKNLRFPVSETISFTTSRSGTSWKTSSTTSQSSSIFVSEKTGSRTEVQIPVASSFTAGREMGRKSSLSRFVFKAALPIKPGGPIEIENFSTVKIETWSRSCWNRDLRALPLSRLVEMSFLKRLIISRMSSCPCWNCQNWDSQLRPCQDKSRPSGQFLLRCTNSLSKFKWWD